MATNIPMIKHMPFNLLVRAGETMNSLNAWFVYIEGHWYTLMITPAFNINVYGVK